MEYTRLSKKELIDILEQISNVLTDTPRQPLSTPESFLDQTDLENLIGTIPFLLLNQQIFERNQDIADFAQKLDIFIPSPEKKKREDIIGRIVSAVASFDNRKIAELNIAIKSLRKGGFKRGKSNFFRDWENAIQQMKI